MTLVARLFVALMVLSPVWPSSAQDMIRGLDLTSPAFTSAEISRADVEAMISKRQPGQALDLSSKSLNGLDLSKLDLSGANLRSARLNHANLAGANLQGALLDQAWALGADFTEANLSGAHLFGAQLLRAKM